MSARRPRERLRLLAAASAGLALYAFWIRPRLLTWGATTQETTRAYPGDELVPEPDGGATMATTLPAPPEAVWSWLVQMGGDRGGWYSWDLLDNNGRPSTDRIVPEWQSLLVGQHLYTAPDGPSRFVVAVLEANRTLVLRGDYSEDLDGIWGFHLRPVPGGGTRLVVRTRHRWRPRAGMWLLDLLWSEPLHFMMQTRQFQNLRARVGQLPHTRGTESGVKRRFRSFRREAARRTGSYEAAAVCPPRCSGGTHQISARAESARWRH